MKTREANKKDLSFKKLAAFVTLIAGFCILNCLALQARDYPNYYPSQEIPFEQLVMDEPNEMFRVQGWLFEIHTRIVAQIVQQRISNNYSQKHSGAITNKSKPGAPSHRATVYSDRGGSNQSVLGIQY